MQEERDQCCCENQSVNIEDWETEHSLLYDYDQRNELEDPSTIEELENQKLFEQIQEPEVRLVFDDIFFIDQEDFYPSYYNDDIEIDIPPIEFVSKDSVNINDEGWNGIKFDNMSVDDEFVDEFAVIKEKFDDLRIETPLIT